MKCICVAASQVIRGFVGHAGHVVAHTGVAVNGGISHVSAYGVPCLSDAGVLLLPLTVGFVLMCVGAGDACACVRV